MRRLRHHLQIAAAALLALALPARADSLGPNGVCIQDDSGSGWCAAIEDVSGVKALDVNVVQIVGGPGGAGGDVDQGAAGVDPWLVTGTLTCEGPLTNAELRGVPVPVSGTLTCEGPLTDAELRATPVPVDATGQALDCSAATVSIAATALPLPANASAETGGNLDAILAALLGTLSVSGTVTANLGTIGSAATAANQATEITSLSSIDGKLATLGAHNTAGSVSVAPATDATFLISGSVSCSGTVTCSGPLTDAQLRASAVPVDATGSAVSCSGTVTANIGTTGGLCLDATLTGGTALSIVRGGAKGATAAATATSTAQGADHQALDVQLYSGAGAIDPTQVRPLTSSDVVTCAQATAASLKATVTQGPAGASAWLVDGSGVTQPISAASLPLPTGAALDTTVSGLEVAQASTTSGQVGPLCQGAATTSAPSYTTAKTYPLSLNTSGGLRVDGSGVTQPVSGSVTCSGTVAVTQGTSPWVVDGSGVTQPVSGTVTCAQATAASLKATVTQGPAGASAWPVDPSGVTSPVSVASLPLPSGAATEATLALLPLAQASTTAGQSGPLAQCAVTTNAPSYTTAQTDPLSCTTGGRLRVDGAGGTFPVSYSSGTFIVGDGSGPLTVDGTVAVSNAFALDSSVNGLLLAQASTTSGQSGPLCQTATTTSAPSYTTAKTNPLSTTTAGALRVDGSGVTQPVSQIGTWSELAKGDTAVGGALSTNPVHIGYADASGNVQRLTGLLTDYDSGAGSQNMSAFGILIPKSGGAVAGGDTNNPFATSNAILDALSLAQASTTSGQSGVMALGAVTTGNPTYVTAKTYPLSIDTSGGLRVSMINSVAGGTSSTYGSAFPSVGTAAGFTDGTNMQGAKVYDRDTGGGTDYVLGCNLRLGASGASVEFGTSSNPFRIDPTGSTTQPVSGTVTANQGGAPWSASQSGTWNIGTVTTLTSITNAVTAKQVDATTIAQSLSMASVSNAVTLTLGYGQSSAAVQITGGSWTGTLVFEAQLDGSNWYAVQGIVPTTGAATAGTTVNGQWTIPVAGYAAVRVRVSVTGSNSATVSIGGSAGTNLISLANALPTGANVVGAVTQSGGPWTSDLTKIGGTNVGATNPLYVSGGIDDAASTSGKKALLLAAVSGSTSYWLTADNNGLLKISGGAANGAAVLGNPVRVAGSDGTNAYTFKTDTSGNLGVGLGSAGSASTNVVTIQGIASMTAVQDDLVKVGGATYSLAVKPAATSAPVIVSQDATYLAGVFAAASAGSKDYLNVFNGSGSGKVMKVRKVTVTPEFAGTVTGAAASFLMKRFTTDGATCTTVTPTLIDTTNAAVPAQVTATSTCTTDPAGTVVQLGTCTVAADDGNTTGGMMQHICYEAIANGAQPWTFQTGQGLTLTNTSTAPGWLVTATITFTLEYLHPAFLVLLALALRRRRSVLWTPGQ